MIPRLKPALGREELTAALRPSSPDDVERFEQEFASRMGQKHAVAFPYGRTALMMLLEAFGIKGREVICPAYTCVVVAHAIVMSGNEPVFVDSSESGFNMDLSLAAGAITEKTAAIVATSLFGYPVDLGAIEQIRREHPHVRIIQDCCHSFDCSWKGKPVQRAGDAAFFGMNISKLMTSIFGGMVSIDDDSLAQRLRDLRDQKLEPAPFSKSLRRLAYLLAVYPAFSPELYGVTNAMERAGLLGGLADYYDESRIDMPADHLQRMCAIEARVGCVQATKLPEIIAHRRRLAADYDRDLRGVGGLTLPPLVEGATYSHYVARIASREALIEKMRGHGVQLGRLIEYCIPEMKAYQGKKFINRNVSPRLKNETLNLPVHSSIGEAQREKIVRLLKQLISKA